MSIAWLNGRWIDDAEAAVPADDPGFLYGDAAFETGRLVSGGFFRLEQHLERLQASAAALALPLPARQELRAIAYGLAERNGFDEATLRITITRGAAAGPLLLGTLSALAPDWREQAARGWRVLTAAVCHPPLSCLPPVKTPGRLHGLLARVEARRAAADDALLLTPSGEVCEGPTWNVFWRRGETLFTPSPDTGVLEGVTRAALLELAPACGYDVRQGRYPRAELDSADEVFASMTSLGLVSFAALEGRALPPDQRHAARRLFQAYWELARAEAR